LKKMKTANTLLCNLFMIIIGLLISVDAYSQFGKPNFEKTSIDRASVEFDCAKDKISVVRTAKYAGGGLIVLNACEQIVYYECMGTVCQQRCNYSEKASDYSGTGETEGKFHKQVLERASVEFEVPQTDIKQIKHYDGKGQGSYYLLIKGNEVVYECAGTVCNLKCEK